MESFLKYIVLSSLVLLLALLSGLPISTATKTDAFTSQICPLQGEVKISALVEQAECLYKEGRFDDAIRRWEQIAKAYKGDINQALALSNQALSYQQRGDRKLGDWEKANQKIQESMKILHPDNRNNISYAQSQAYAQVLDIKGQIEYAQSKTEEALKTWEQAEQIYTQIKDNSGLIVNQLNQAQALQVLGSHLQAQKILNNWDELLTNPIKAIYIDSKFKDSKFKAQGLRILGNTYTRLGELDKSEQALEKAKSLELPEEEKVSILLSLGNTQRAKAKNLRELREANEYNEYEDCKQYRYDENQQLKQEIEYAKKALQFYRDTVTSVNNAKSNNNLRITKLQAQLNQISLLSEINEPNTQAESQKILPEIEQQLRDGLTEYNRSTAFAQINYAQSLICLEKSKNRLNSSYKSSYKKSAGLFSSAYNVAKEIGDKRTMSYALGNLGRLYENTGQFAEAEKVTRQALSLAQSINAPDITYQWQWQLGRIIVSQSRDERREEATKIYEEAAETLRSIRGDLLAINRDVQFSFRDNIEPVYRELISLLLPISDDKPSQKNLEKALYYSENIQLAELENFFGCSLQNIGIEKINLNDNQKSTKEKIMKQVNTFVENEPDSALVYPILLKDHLAVIVKLPGQSNLIYKSASKNQEEVQKILNVTISALTTEKTTDISDKYMLQSLYQWLIQPYEEDLKNNQKKVNNLIFILDGSLRSIPINALHDKRDNRYVLEKDYTVAVAPSIQLLQPIKKNKVQKTTQPKVLIAASVIAREPDFPKLNKVTEQIKNIIINKLKNPKILLYDKNDDSGKFSKTENQFTSQNFESAINSSNYNVIHLITHGVFSSNSKDTFIITDDKPQSENRDEYSINFNEMGNILQNKSKRGSAIDLLIFTACDTAKGDNRSILGMAGLAIKSGANSTIATVWKANENSAEKFTDYFYPALVENKKMSKAALLQKIQRQIKKDYQAPYDWAAFIIVRN